METNLNAIYQQNFEHKLYFTYRSWKTLQNDSRNEDAFDGKSTLMQENIIILDSQDLAVLP